ncbi:MAG: PAS domain S-box protein, partial [Verrucomicrobia bacterium]|nr:PAS domain S-box protein [Verrucomicrobiota bacterium]
PQTDEYGTFISALAPVLDPQTGELRLAIGVDMEATAWRVAVNRARLGPLLFALLLLATLLVGQTLLGRRERFPAERQGWLRHVEAALAAAVGLELSLAATWLARDAELRLRQNNFQALARAQSSIVMEGFRNLRGRLNTLGRFFESSAYVDRREFQNYAEPLARDGLCQGWGWVPSVAAPAVADVEAEAQRDGLTDFSIWQDNAEGARIPATGHERYFPMFYVTPVPKLEKMLGFDMGSEPVRRAALDEARRAGQATATDPVTLFALPDQPKGIVVFQAVASRRYKGFVVASVRLDALVELALLRSGGREAANAVDLFQLEPDGKTCPLTSFPSNHVCGYPSWTPGAGISFPLFAFGKTFGLIIHPLPGWLAAHPMRGQWLVALAGLVLTGMLTVFIGFLTRRRAVLEKEVQARTAELQTKSDELGRFFSSALDLLCITDTDGYVRRLNSEWEKMLGYPQNELIGHAAMDFIHPEDHRATLKALSSLRRGRPILSLTIRCRRKDGSYRWIEWKAVSSGPLVYASARDITERRQVEEHLRFQALLLDCVSESVVATNLEGRILYWSRGAEKVYGYTAEEVMNKPYRDFGGTIEPVDRAAFKRELLARGSWRGEHVQRKRDGTTFWTTTYISVVLDSAGRPCGFIGIDLDITERKRSEEALRASEERFEQVAESAGEWIWERDSEGLFTYSSPVVEQILGYKPEELVGKKHFYDLLAPNVREKIKKAAAERTLRKEAFRKFANPVVHQDGHVVILETTGTPILDREGRMVGYRGVNTDITERRRAEEALRTSEERFEQVAESAGEWIWEMDAEGLYTYSNPVVEEILGYKPEELVGKKHFYELFTPEVREEIKQEALGRTLRKEAFRKLANPVVRKDGRVVILETTGLPILDREGRLIGYRGADTDITERRRAEEALRTLSSRQQALLAAIPDIIMEVDTRNIYTWANRAGYDFFGEEVIGKEAVFYFEGEQEIYRAVQSLFNGEESVIYVESWQRRRDGQKRLLAWWCRVIKDENGEVVGALSTARDITEQRTLEEQLRQAQKIEAVGRLAGGV